MSGEIIVSDKLPTAGHGMPEAWLRARVRGWMELIESPDMDYWIGTHAPDGRWISCSSRSDGWLPKPTKQTYAIEICAFLNREVSCGGAWLAGWIRGGRTFYLLWKDEDGDIQVPIECDLAWDVVRTWKPTDWAKQAIHAVAVFREWQRNLELSPSQKKKVAQGEKISQNHLQNAV